MSAAKKKSPKPKPQPDHFVHVNGHTLRKNRCHATADPPIAVRQGRGGSSAYAHRVEIVDREGNVVAVVEYKPDAPLGCGAVVWVRCLYQPVAKLAQSTRGRGARATGSAP